MNLRRTIYRLLQPAGPNDRASRVLDLLLIFLILGDFLAFVLETIPELDHWHGAFRAYEWFTVSVFLIEYILRAWSITTSVEYRDPVKGRLRYLVSPVALVDLVAISPVFFIVYHGIAGGEAGEVPGQLTILRIVRLVRLFKIARYSPAIVTVQRALHRVRHELNVLLAGIFTVLVIASTLLHAVESEVQPEAFGSIPRAFWYAVVSLTTVGFGDVVVATAWGKVITSFLALAGIALFALPSGLLGAAFAAEIRRVRQGQSDHHYLQCPHCNEELFYEPKSGIVHSDPPIEE